jgi:hypothetical protein
MKGGPLRDYLVHAPTKDRNLSANPFAPAAEGVAQSRSQVQA